MNPVVGLDIANGVSQGQAFLGKGKPHGKSFTVHHTREGLDAFLQLLKDIQSLAGQLPMVIMEATGHYHTPVTQLLDEHNYLYIIVNPLLSYQAKKSSSLRKVKTDAIDAYALCEFFYKEDFEPHKRRGLQLLNLRNLTRQHESVTDQFVQIKLQLRLY